MRKRKEAIAINGRYIHCCHYRSSATDEIARMREASSDTEFLCAKHGKRTTCASCYTCPKCGGMVHLEREQETMGMSKVIATYTRTCHICGMVISEEKSVERAQKLKHDQPNANLAPFCSVKGCKCRAWDDHRHKEVVDGKEKVFLLCETHARRMKTWHLNKKKGIEQKPLMVA